MAEKRHKPRPCTRGCEDRSESSLSKHVICETSHDLTVVYSRLSGREEEQA